MSREQFRFQRLPRGCVLAYALVMLAVSAAITQTAGAQTRPATGQTPPRQALQSWWDRSRDGTVGRYWIKTDLPPDEVRPIAEHLNRMYEEYALRMAGLDVRAQEQLDVYLFARERDYQMTLRARFGVSAEGSGGLFFANALGTGLALFAEGLTARRLEHVLQHEAFHQFAYARFGEDLPPWVNEGLAEFFGEGVLVGDRLILGQNTPRTIALVRDAVDAQQHVPFDQMLGMTPPAWNEAMRGERGELIYAQAWSMVQFLVFGDGGAYVKRFELYLRHLANGLPSREAFARVFDDDVIGFERQWRAAALAAVPSAFKTAHERAEFLAAGLHALAKLERRPQTLEVLKAALVEIGFETSHFVHGREVVQAVSDEVFTIPAEGPEGEAAVFVLEPFNANRLSLRERRIEEKHPRPPTLRTSGLVPRDIEVRWIRGEDPATFTYEIVVK